MTPNGNEDAFVVGSITHAIALYLNWKKAADASIGIVTC